MLNRSDDLGVWSAKTNAETHEVPWKRGENGGRHEGMLPVNLSHGVFGHQEASACARNQPRDSISSIPKKTLKKHATAGNKQGWKNQRNQSEGQSQESHQHQEPVPWQRAQVAQAPQQQEHVGSKASEDKGPPGRDRQVLRQRI